MKKFNVISVLVASSAAFAMPMAAYAKDDTSVASCDATSLSSEPGQAWDNAYGWRYNVSTAVDQKERNAENLVNRQQAYNALVTGQSPWPDWFSPDVSILEPGVLFQMAMSPESVQPNDQPGGFGTFDDIANIEEVRDDLAVLQKWKPDVARVVTYRVREVLPVRVGPIGPQVDPDTCKLLFGRYSQFEMLVPKLQRSHYLEFVSSRPIN